MSIRIALAALLLLPTVAVAQTPPDGETIFRRDCSACHGMDARNRVGPGLAGFWGRAAGAAENFRYSAAMRAKAEAGLRWDEETVRAYLRNPREVVPGGTMAYPGLRDEARLEALVAWLRERSAAQP
ncbi:c-type cytochrome [Muricoccus radiodurans]|uniref:c-type cytochrome n=1 Tax=Muricoccus radiodurans TaxID=2231721 RepID=UPI003CEF5377